MTKHKKTRLVLRSVMRGLYAASKQELLYSHNSSYRHMRPSGGHALSLGEVLSGCPDNLLVPCPSHLYSRGGERIFECQASCLRTQHNGPEQALSPDLSVHNLTHQSLDDLVSLKSSWTDILSCWPNYSPFPFIHVYSQAICFFLFLNFVLSRFVS